MSVRFFTIVLLFFLLVATPVYPAGDLDLNDSILQDEFDKSIRDLGVAFSYTPVETPEAKGVSGFNAGIAITGAKLNDDATYMTNTFSNGDAPGYAVLPKIYLAKGLPLNFDVETFLAKRPDGNERLYGGAIKWSYWEGSSVAPALGIRAHGTKLDGVNELDLKTYGADLSISKGFTVVTPYAGYSLFEIDGEATGSTALNNLDPLSTTENRFFAGTRLTLGIFNVVGEADLGEVNSYSLRANIEF